MNANETPTDAEIEARKAATKQLTDALRAIFDALEPLAPGARMRVLRAVDCLLDIRPPAPTGFTPRSGDPF